MVATVGADRDRRIERCRHVAAVARRERRQEHEHAAAFERCHRRARGRYGFAFRPSIRTRQLASSAPPGIALVPRLRACRAERRVGETDALVHERAEEIPPVHRRFVARVGYCRLRRGQRCAHQTRPMLPRHARLLEPTVNGGEHRRRRVRRAGVRGTGAAPATVEQFHAGAAARANRVPRRRCRARSFRCVAARGQDKPEPLTGRESAEAGHAHAVRRRGLRGHPPAIQRERTRHLDFRRAQRKAGYRDRAHRADRGAAATAETAVIEEKIPRRGAGRRRGRPRRSGRIRCDVSAVADRRRCADRPAHPGPGAGRSRSLWGGGFHRAPDRARLAAGSRGDGATPFRGEAPSKEGASPPQGTTFSESPGHHRRRRSRHARWRPFGDGGSSAQ